jgi:hypothetical protein
VTDLPGVTSITTSAKDQVRQSLLPGAPTKEVDATHSCGRLDSAPATRVLVTRADARRWRADAYWCTPTHHPPTPEEQAEPEMTLQRIARELHLPVGTATPGDLFGEIEHQLIDERVNIAPLGFALRADLTPWVIGPVVLGLLALIRNCTRRVLEDREYAIDEPWLLVDDGVGLERVVAGLWIASIAIAPWICGASIFASFAWRVYADGSLTTALTDVTLIALAGIVLIAGAWLGLTVASDLIALREARRLHGDPTPRSVAAGPDY